MSRVSWTAGAQQQLADIWMASRFKLEVNQAVEAIDEQLARNPRTIGESREGDYRVLFDWPLVVTYLAESSNTEVYVVSVRTMN